MRYQSWIGGHAVTLQVPEDGQGGLIDAVPAGSTPFLPPGGGQAVQGTALSGLAVPHGRIFSLRGDQTAFFHVTIPFQRALPQLVQDKIGEPPRKRPRPILRRVFFKYYSFLHDRRFENMSRVAFVRAFDAGETRGPWGALSPQNNPNGMPGFQLDNYGNPNRRRAEHR